MLTTNLKLTLAYDGADFFGFKKSKEGKSVEEELEKALNIVFQEPLLLNAASRTDRGVHALCQVVNVTISKAHIDVKKLQISLNQLLPKSIALRDVEIVDKDFHATLDVVSKVYKYDVTYGIYQLPGLRRSAWHLYHELDLEAILEGAKILIGEHDFAAFCNVCKDEPYKTTVRCVKSIEVERIEKGHIRFTIFGENFLYKMVRNIVGTLVYVGLKKLLLSDIEMILKSCDRKYAGVTAPAHGLTLFLVEYAGDEGRTSVLVK